ncbi:winged helix-turn-helix transcriptional regulator [Candidatus Aenigmatarchaeota archaeon]
MKDKNFLDLKVRRDIYNCIVKSPGLHFREIQRRIKLATGSLDYHIHFLYKNNMIRKEKDGKYTRYYPLTRNWNEEERAILSLLRQKQVRHIIIYLIEKKRATATDISTSLEMTPSTLSWYLKQLVGKNVITQQKKGRFRIYSVNDPEKMTQHIITHKSSFLDTIVDNFIDAWEAK